MEHTGFIGAKCGLPHAEPATFLLLRFALVIAMMLPLALLLQAAWPATPPQAAHIAVAGMLLHGGFLGGVFTAIHQGVSAGVSAPVVGLQPILTAVVAGRFLSERVGLRRRLGLALGLGGVRAGAFRGGVRPCAGALDHRIRRGPGVAGGGALDRRDFAPQAAHPARCGDEVASLFHLVPPLTALIAYLLFGERLDLLGLAGFALAAAGVALVVRG